MIEAMRRSVRGFIGYDSAIYRVLARLAFIVACVRGGSGGRRLLTLWSAGKRHDARASRLNECKLTFPKLVHPIHVRPGTDDVHSLVDNVLREEYGQFPPGFHPATVVDAGAYIGDTTAYLASRFRGARCLALEPSFAAYLQAVKNLSPYGNQVALLNAALWSSDCEVMIGGEQTAASVGAEGVAVKAVSVPHVMEQLGAADLDLLKMDIEGSELEVLRSGDGSWLRRIKMLLLETHGCEIENEVIPLLRRNGFSVNRFRNVWYCQRRQ